MMRRCIRFYASLALMLVLLSNGLSHGEAYLSGRDSGLWKKDPTPRFVCGTYRGNELEGLWQFAHYENVLKKSAFRQSAEFIFDDVWVVEDDGAILLSGVNTFDTDNQTFRFDRNANNGYTVTSVSFNFDSDLGANLGLGDDTNVTRNLNFDFNFFGTPWSDVHINANGIVSFGVDVNPSGFYNNNNFFSAVPKIAPYFMDFNPAVGGAVFAKSEIDKFTITWNSVPEFGATNSNTIQLVLFPTGSFSITFNGIAARIATSGTPIAFGIHPGGTPNLEIISFSEDLPHTGGAGAGIFENYLNITQPVVNSTALMKRFYQTFADSFFQVVFFTNFSQTMAGFANEQNIKNLVGGIGLGLFDLSGTFGSNGVLESRVNMNQLAVWPDDPEQRFFSDGNNFLTIMGQEAGHRWGAFVNFIDSNGQTSNLILGRADAHWSFYFDSDHSSLEGGNWDEVSDNEFVVPTEIDFFSEIDQYIMGLRTPEEVKPMFFISSPTNNQPQNRSRGTPNLGDIAAGTAVEVTIEDIIAAEGPRIPIESDALKNLRQAFILITRNGNNPAQSDLNKIANFRRVWEDYFEVSVGGRLAINTSLDRTFPVAVIKGHILDATTKLPISDIRVESIERGFSQFVAGGGRYTFRYMADQSSGPEEVITLQVGAPGYQPSDFSTALAYGVEVEIDIELQPVATAINDRNSRTPLTFALHQNYPNPFNPSTEIRYEVAEAVDVSLTIYDLLGRKVRDLVKGKQSAGPYAVQWDGRDERGRQVASGVYLLRLTAGSLSRSRKMLLMR
ncbi:T9SS type A sorting domain-containing protein [bacterium]|nr:T9SS type A sorting domain-containing protein [bacterium]